MSDYELHPITGEYADLTEPEVNALRASLTETGQCIPIVIWKNQIVDGRHRKKLCDELRILPKYYDISQICPTEEKMRRYVAGLNEHRRSRITPLTSEEKRAKAAAAIEANPERSDVAIAEDLGDVSRPTVYRVRKKLEESGVVKRTTPAKRKSRTGKVGGCSLDSFRFLQGLQKTGFSDIEMPQSLLLSPFLQCLAPTIRWNGIVLFQNFRVVLGCKSTNALGTDEQQG